MRIFVSHHHEEKLLAQAWQRLMSYLSQGVVAPWYSSDDRASGGVTPGEWHPQVRQEIESANVILVLITPISNEKPWLFYESGLASGQKKLIIPVYYFMRQEGLNSVFRNLQCYDGNSLDGVNGVRALCGRLMRERLTKDLPDDMRQVWEPFFEGYLQSVQSERTHSYSRTLFHDQFHNFNSALTMEGKWFAKWTELWVDGTERVFEVDSLFAWTSELRLRMVGTSEKHGLEAMTEATRATARLYPVEGVVSRAGWFAASYWSAGSIPICGTVLLAPKGMSGELLEGTWQGFTARNINEEPTFTKGRVVMARLRPTVESYWPKLQPAPEG
jgi:TIR domain